MKFDLRQKYNVLGFFSPFLYNSETGYLHCNIASVSDRYMLISKIGTLVFYFPFIQHLMPCVFYIDMYLEKNFVRINRFPLLDKLIWINNYF